MSEAPRWFSPNNVEDYLLMEDALEEHYDWDAEVIECRGCGQFHPLSKDCETEEEMILRLLDLLTEITEANGNE